MEMLYTEMDANSMKYWSKFLRAVDLMASLQVLHFFVEYPMVTVVMKWVSVTIHVHVHVFMYVCPCTVVVHVQCVYMCMFMVCVYVYVYGVCVCVCICKL